MQLVELNNLLSFIVCNLLRTISDWRAWRAVGFVNKGVTQNTTFFLPSRYCYMQGILYFIAGSAAKGLLGGFSLVSIYQTGVTLFDQFLKLFLFGFFN
jgi:hypothetical protein